MKLYERRHHPHLGKHYKNVMQKQIPIMIPFRIDSVFKGILWTLSNIMIELLCEKVDS